MLPALAESSSPVIRSVIPDWAVTLRLVIAETRRSTLNSSVLANSTHREPNNRPLPFEDVFAPFVAVARERLRNVACSALSVLSPSAVIAFERQLLAHMSFVAHLVLAEDFSHFRFSRAPAAAFEAIWNQTETSTEIYDAYVAQCADLWELMRKRPVLSRLLGQSVNQWVTATANVCHRFADDFLFLKHTFQWDCTSPDGAIEMALPVAHSV
jgi:class II lanthipeptide synthase